MAKRVSLRERRAGDAKGIDAIFQSTSPPQELEIKESAQGDTEQLPNEQLQTETAPASEIIPSAKSKSASKAHAEEPNQPSALNNPQAQADKPIVSKVTLYIRPDQVFAVEAIQLAERQRTGQKPDKSELIQEALDLLIEKYGPL